MSRYGYPITGSPSAGGAVITATADYLFPWLKNTNGTIHADILAALTAGRLGVGDVIQTAAYWQGSDLGGCTYRVVAAATGTDDGGSYIDAGSVQLEAVFVGSVDVAQFGAKGDGAVDDTAAIQAAIDFAPRVVLSGQHRTTATITIDSPTELVGLSMASSIVGTAAESLLDIESDDVTISDLTISSTASDNASANRLIQTTGSTAIAPHSNIDLRRLRMSDAWAAVWLSHVNHLTIADVEISDVTYGGIMVLSGQNGTIHNVKVTNVIGDDASGNSYGIALTRTDGTLADHPRPSKIAVSDCVVDGAPWEAYDTHGGEYLTFTGCHAHNCRTGLAIVPAQTYAPSHVTAVGFVAESGVTDGSSTHGVIATGSASELAKNVVLDVTVRGFGAEASDLSGGVTLYRTEGARVRFTASECVNAGLMLYYDNYGFNASGVAVDSWTENNAGAAGVILRSTNNEGVISDVTIRRGSKSATIVLSRGIWARADSPKVQLGSGLDLDVATLPLLGAFANYGSTAQRPTSPIESSVYWDRTLKAFITWDGTAWVNLDGSAL